MSGELVAGDVIDSAYVLETPAGEELLGRVWFAKDTRRNRRVRLKMLRRDHLLDDRRFRRFQREIEASGRVKSPGLLPLLDSGVHDGLAYAVFPAVPEQTLAMRVSAGPTPWRQVVQILMPLVAAVGALHREGIVHRDLVPHNVLLDGELRPWIRDLGLVWLVSVDDDTASLTEGDDRVGHLAAMAPEYLAQQELTPAADLYALGVLAFELLTGTPVFEGQGNGLVRLALGAVPPAPSSRAPDVPRWLDRLVLSLLEKDPGLRPHPDTIQARLVQGLSDTPAAPGRRRTGWVVASVAAMAGVGLLGAGAWFLGRGPAAPSGLEADAVALPAAEAVSELWLLPPARPLGGVRVVRSLPEATAADPVVVGAASGILVRSNQRALVTLDGQPAGFTPLRVHGAPGPHRLQVGLPARLDTRQERPVVFREKEILEVEFVF